MIRLHKAENRISIENEYLRVTSMTNVNQNACFSFYDDVAVNEYGNYNRTTLHNGYIILLPLLNDIRVDIEGFKWKIEINQVFVYYLEKDKSFAVEGANGMDFCYFLALFIPKENNRSNNVLLPIELNVKNKLKKIVRTNDLNIYLGNYELSKTDDLPLKRTDQNWVISSITGVFEVNERLIESRDVLEIIDQQYADIESLSTESLILVIEY